MSELHHKIAFASIRGITPALAAELTDKVGSEAAFFTAPEAELRAITGSRSKIYTRSYRDELLEKSCREAEFIQKNHIRPIYYTDPDFPHCVDVADDAPLMLYTLGEMPKPKAKIIAVVGTRHASPYGAEFTRHLVEDLAAEVDNLVIVSGLAYGIDIAAHRAALRAGVPTVAVLAHGLHTIYPADHRSTAIEIVRSGGGLISEYRSDTPIHKGNFVARNRIVASMAHCLMVCESAEKGGAMITASLAFGYGRDVFALPGRISDNYSAGCNRLIANDMARLVTSADDIITAMSWPRKSASEAVQEPQLPLILTQDEEAVIRHLESHDDATLSELTAATGLPIGKMMSLLVDMEFRNLILTLPGARYRKL